MNDWLAWMTLGWSLLGTAGSLYLSVGMKLRACPLCFYQRSFVMAVFTVYLMAAWAGIQPSATWATLAWPLGVAGMGVAAFHEWLVLKRVLECPKGVGGLGSAPLQSLLMFLVLVILLAVHALAGATDGAWFSLGLGFVVGLVLAGTSIWSSPPLPPVPTQAYAEPLVICRPPYVPANSR